MKDKTIVCKSCGQEFVFSIGEQNFFADKKMTDPIRCKPCRDEKKARNVRIVKKVDIQPRGYKIDPNIDWVGAMNERFEEQFREFGHKDLED